MVYEKFLTTVKERMAQSLGTDYKLTLRKVPKNNGLVLDGLCITKGDSHIAPAIYLNPCYQQYKEGLSINSIVDGLILLYRRNETPPPLDYQMLSNYEEVKPRIACRLINAASNKELLKELPHVLWLDLAIVFYLCIHEDEAGLMTALIYNSHMNLWNISLKELEETARANTQALFPPVISSMSHVIEQINEELIEHGDMDIADELPDPEQSAPFYVLSSTSGVHGAACILYKDILKNFAEGMERDIIILPSSIHEVLLLPDEEDVSYEDMSQLVTHINSTEVPEEERLSNHVYLYSRSTETIGLASAAHCPIC